MASTPPFRMVNYTPISTFSILFSSIPPQQHRKQPNMTQTPFLYSPFYFLILCFLNNSNASLSLLLSISPCMKWSCTYCSPLWSKAAVLSFPPRSASFHLHQLHQIIWSITPAAAAQEVPDEAVRFPFEGGIIKETQRGEKSFVFCCGWSFESSLMWFILPPVPSSSLAIPLQHSGCAPHKRQNVFPWKQTCHSTAGLSNKIHLCREEPAGDPTNLASVQWCDFWKPSCVWTVWAPAVIVPRKHLTESFALFISSMAFLQLYLLPSLLWLILSERSMPLFNYSWNTDALREKSCFRTNHFSQKDSRIKN